MEQFCQSCGMPVAEGGKYCQYCADENGNLHPRETIKQGLAQWLQQLAGPDAKADFQKRAEYYMKAMPAWAEE